LTLSENKSIFAGAKGIKIVLYPCLI
jgi:hypothetical protein